MHEHMVDVTQGTCLISHDVQRQAKHAFTDQQVRRGRVVRGERRKLPGNVEGFLQIAGHVVVGTTDPTACESDIQGRCSSAASSQALLQAASLCRRRLNMHQR